MTTVTRPAETFFSYRWSRPHDHLRGELLTCEAAVMTGTPDKPGRTLASASACWSAGIGGWELIQANRPLEPTWPKPPRDMQPKSRIYDPDDEFVPGNFYQVDNIEGSIQIGNVKVNVRDSIEHPDKVPGYVMLGSDHQRTLNLAAYLIASAGLSIDHDVCPLVGKILNQWKR